MVNQGEIILSIHLSPDSIWKVSPQDPESTPIDGLLGAQLLNPLLHSQIFRDPNPWAGSDVPKVIGLGEDFALIRSPYLAFATNVDTVKQLTPPDAQDSFKVYLEETMMDIAKSFVRALRYVTKQARLPNDPGYGMMMARTLPERVLRYPEIQEGCAYVTEYELRTAITLQGVIEADKIRSR